MVWTYELFLDREGQKISKSKGNGLSMEDWLAYGPAESLAHFMYQKPKTAKRLFLDVIPKSTDSIDFVGKLAVKTIPPSWLKNPPGIFTASRAPKGAASPIPCCSISHLAANAENADMLWGYIRQYDGGRSPESQPFLAILVERCRGLLSRLH